jgi:segregation and condensation protein B
VTKDDGSSGEFPQAAAGPLSVVATEPAEPRPGNPGPEATDGSAPPGSLTVAQLEALLFVAERPLGRREIATLAGVDLSTVDDRLGDLEVDLRDRGIRLLASGDRVALATAPEAGAMIARYVGVDPGRLTPAALETLAIVAYQQPVTRAVVEGIRGVDSDYVLRSLVHRRLVVEAGRADAPGRPILYGTGLEFLERFGLASLDDLPVLDADVAGRLVADAPGTLGPLEGADEQLAAEEASLPVEAPDPVNGRSLERVGDA